MRCSVCGNDAVVIVQRERKAFCSRHYIEWFESMVARAIKRYGMLHTGERVLVAVSGGKDSLVLWHILSEMGYDTTGLYIDLGIEGYSEDAFTTVKRFSEKWKLSFFRVSVRESYGLSIPEFATFTRRKTCSVCGLTKRYIMNRMAVEYGFDAIATGHNMDDETAVLMGNLLHWQMDALGRQSPLLESGEMLARRIKPLVLLTERDVVYYAMIRGIEYQMDECPYAEGAKTILYKEAMNLLESEMPGTKRVFMEQFLKKARPLFESEYSQKADVHGCARCGFPTTASVCSFCRTWDLAYRWAHRKKVLPPEVEFSPQPEVEFYEGGRKAPLPQGMSTQSL